MKSLREVLLVRSIKNNISLRNIFNKYGLETSCSLDFLLQKLANFRLVAIGDSVMWGQGLLDSEKAFNIVGQSVKTKFPKINLTIENYSHSGAIIGSIEQRLDTRDGVFGEIPNDFPTILRQLDISSREINLFNDLVLLNGGLNDINFKTIINPYGGDINALCKANCYDRMVTLLKATHEKYPNANIVCTGYYKIFSHKSRLEGIALILLAFDIISTVLGFVLGETVIERCTTFFNYSEYYLKKAIEDSNLQINNKAKFIACNWDDSNSMFASNPFLFALNLDLSAQDNPTIIQKRIENCPDIVLIDEDIPDIEISIGDLVPDIGIDISNNVSIETPDLTIKLPNLQCQRASAGHPNVRGAKENAKNIIAFMWDFH